MNQDYLNFETFMTNANISEIAHNIKELNKRIIKQKNYDPVLVMTINNIHTVLENISVMLNNKNTVKEDKQKQSIEKLIVVHQALMDYRRDNNIVDGLIINVMNELTVFYPLFLVSELIDLT